MSGEIFSIFYWWVVVFSLGLIFLPLTNLIFKSFFDRGYAISKILALLLVSYTIWILASLKLAAFTSLSLFIIIGIFLVINSLISSKTTSFSHLRPHLMTFIFEEVLFILGFIFWVYIRSFEPSVHGLEKFMDFGFINSILLSNYFPPLDIWLPPFSINYYYFGHLTAAVLIKLTGLNPALSYNLVLAMLFGITLSVSFSIGANLYHLFLQHSEKYSKNFLPVAGLISAFVVTLGGNLHTVYAFFQNYTPPENPVPFWQLPFLFNFTGYWYPNATRFIPFTIHEFPIYSFVVADLHGHVLNIPFVLLTIALLIKIFFDSKLQPITYGLLSLLVATSLMTNVLDGPIYIMLIFLVILFKNLKESSWVKSAIQAVRFSAITTFLAAIFSLPFWLAFKPFASGIGVLCAPDFLTSIGKIGPFLFEANHCARSPFWMLVILWGFFYALVLGYWFLVIRKGTKHSTDYLVLAFITTATLLILIPEFFYAKDIYPAHYRANTVFKFGYQAFIILGLISGYLVTRVIINKKKVIFFLIPFAFLFFLIAIYPYFAINSYYGLKNSKGLDGLKYLGELYPSDHRGVLWIQKNIKDQPVILEGQGDSYTDFARVSSNTGLPTVIGWPVHEWLWRGSYDEPGKRIADVNTLFESQDLNQTSKLIQKYHIKYVFIGTLERQKYLNLNEAKFLSLGKLIFEDGNTKIYKIN